ncbi:hypothetical protein V8G54_015097 [Vigna mungo]|uniref:Uncharacterized protein n=1 Tax=Vigna mungo TaxID=3915 RepID=A0AAQ3NLE2_VIGMU
MMLATPFFSRRSSSTFAAFFTASFFTGVPSRDWSIAASASTIRRADLWPPPVIRRSGSNRLDPAENATIERRSVGRSDEITCRMEFFIRRSLLPDMAPPTSSTATRSIGARRGGFGA